MTEPDEPRASKGVPERVAKLRALGNALVPQVAQMIGERILAWEQTQVARSANTIP